MLSRPTWLEGNHVTYGSVPVCRLPYCTLAFRATPTAPPPTLLTNALATPQLQQLHLS